MDPDVVKAKLESLARCIRRIESKMPASVADLEEDLDVQDIITLNLERAVQLCVDAGSHILLDLDSPSPDSMAGVFIRLGKEDIIGQPLAGRLAKAVGFRNIAVHEYEQINWKIVYTIITKNLDDFRTFAAALSKRAGP